MASSRIFHIEPLNIVWLCRIDRLTVVVIVDDPLNRRVPRDVVLVVQRRVSVDDPCGEAVTRFAEELRPWPE